MVPVDGPGLSSDATGLTVRGTHALSMGLLLESPEYAAFQPNVPDELNNTGRELGAIPLMTVTVETIEEALLQPPSVNSL
jgi:hypothetical protein